VNEEGTEPSAFTRILRGGGYGPPLQRLEFVADHHPFTVIIEEWSGVVDLCSPAGHVLDAAM
jgi:hypothetical protein